VIDRNLVLAMGTAATLAAIDLRSGQRQWERNFGGQPDAMGGRPLRVRGHLQRRRGVPGARHRQGEVGDAAHPVPRREAPRSHPVGGARCWPATACWSAARPASCWPLSPYTGDIIGKVNIGNPIRLAPVVANRVIYVLTDNGRLIALR
jgi:hypothetical protein